MKKYKVICSLLILITLPDINYAMLSRINNRLISSYNSLLQWYNVKGKPDYIYGSKPKFSMAENLYIVTLKPFDEVFIQLEAYEMMRLLITDDNVDISGLSVSISNGSGLYLQLPIKTKSNQKSILFQPNASFTSVVNIRQDINSKKKISMAVFLSKIKTVNIEAPFINIIKIDAPEIKISNNNDKTISIFYKIFPQQPVISEINGPAHLKIQARLIYPRQTNSNFQTFRIWSRISKENPEMMMFETSPEKNDSVIYNGKYCLTGNMETSYLYIPKGNHKLSLKTDSNLLIRVFVSKQSDYLFQKINSYDFTNEYPNQNYQNFLNKFTLSIEYKQINKFIKIFHDSPDAFQKLSLKLSRSNSTKNGALTGSILLMQRYDFLQKYPEISAYAKKININHTFYNDIISEFIKVSYNQGWYVIVNKLLEQITNIQEINYWQLQIMLKKGQYNKAKHFFYNKTAESFPEKYYEHIKTGFLIQNKMMSSNKEQRLMAILEWEKWQTNHPGPFQWENANQLIIDYKGSRTIYYSDRDLYSNYFIAAKNHPLKIKAVGPAELCLEIRPLHNEQQKIPIDDLVYIKNNDEFEIISVINNIENRSLEIIGYPDEKPGQKQEKQFMIKPGTYQFIIYPHNYDLLANIYIKRPLIYNNVLPFISPFKLVQIADGFLQPKFKKNISSFFNQKNC